MPIRAARKASLKAATKQKSVAVKKTAAKNRATKKTVAKKPTGRKTKAALRRGAAAKKAAKEAKTLSRKSTLAKKPVKKKAAAKRLTSTTQRALKRAGVRSKSTSAKAATSNQLATKKLTGRKTSLRPAEVFESRRAKTVPKPEATPIAISSTEMSILPTRHDDPDNRLGMGGICRQEQNLNPSSISGTRITENEADAAFSERDEKEPYP